MTDHPIDHDAELAAEVAAAINGEGTMTTNFPYPAAAELARDRQATPHSAEVESLRSEIETCLRLLNRNDLWARQGEQPGAIEQRLNAALARLAHLDPIAFRDLAVAVATRTGHDIRRRQTVFRRQIAAALVIAGVIVMLAGLLIATA